MPRSEEPAAVIFAAVLLFALVPAQSQSLWAPESGSLFTDQKASRVGDPVTIVVQESVSGSAQRQSTTAKTVTLNMLGGTGLLVILPPAGFRTGSESSAERGASVRGGLTGRITVRVAEVLPNDVFRLQGARDVLVNNEPYRLLIEGFVRRQDIAADNTVPSDRIADARVVLDGTAAAPPVNAPRRGPLRFIINGFRALLQLLF